MSDPSPRRTRPGRPPRPPHRRGPRLLRHRPGRDPRPHRPLGLRQVLHSRLAVLQLRRPDEGEVWFDGRELTSLNERELRPLSPAMQPVFQDPYGSLGPRHRIRDAIAEPLRVQGSWGRTTGPERVAELLERVGLTRPTATGVRTSCPADSANAPVSPARWRASPSSWCWTNRCPRSTRPCARESSTCSPNSRSASASATCSSATTWRSYATSVTGSRRCARAGSSGRPRCRTRRRPRPPRSLPR